MALKVADLKEELAKRGLDTRGLKKDLAQRLEQAQAEEKAGEASLAPGVLDPQAEAIGIEGAADDLSPRVVAPAPASSTATSTTATPARGPTPAPLSEAEAEPKEEEEAEAEPEVPVMHDKRGREEEPAPSSPKRPRTQARDTALPPALAHLHHPPSAVLYISNLRRPLLLPTLHDYISPSQSSNSPLPPSRAPFSSDDYPNLWLSGVKSHAYACFDTVKDALRVAEKIEGVAWPDVTGAPLHVEFVPKDRVRDLVEREESAWSNGRQQLRLDIQKVGDGWDLNLVASGPRGGGSGGPPPVPLRARPDGIHRNGLGRPILSGANAVGPGAPGGRALPTGPRGYLSPPLVGRNGYGQTRGNYGSRDRFSGLERRTFARPCLVWSEGPGGR